MLSRYSYKHCKRSLGAFGVTLLCISACGDRSQPMVDSIPAVEYDAALRSRISVAGVSSGAYMAVQAQVAYADKIGGVAAVAGGPYHCAAGDVKTALGSCMTGVDLSAEPMIIFAKEAASAGTIAPMDAMQDARVWIFHSPADAVVSSRAGAVLADFYKAFVTGKTSESLTRLSRRMAGQLLTPVSPVASRAVTTSIPAITTRPANLCATFTVTCSRRWRRRSMTT